LESADVFNERETWKVNGRRDDFKGCSRDFGSGYATIGKISILQNQLNGEWLLLITILLFLSQIFSVFVQNNIVFSVK